MTLQITHRPNKLEDVFGNQAIKDGLTSIFARSEDFPHAFLFSGPTGCGKTTFARIIGNLLECESIEELNMSNLRGIDSVRSLAETCVYAPMLGNTRVYILDEIHRQTKDAQNALLKLLEDPPSHVFFILCTTEPEQLLPTILGRCHQYQVKPLKSMEMMALLRSIAKKEKLNDYPENILKEIVGLSEGLPRNALVLFDSIIDIEDEDKAIAALSSVSLSSVNIKELCQAIVKGDTWKNWRKKVKEILVETEPEKLRQAIHGYLMAALYNTDRADRLSGIINEFSEPNFYTPKDIGNVIYRVLTLM